MAYEKEVLEKSILDVSEKHLFRLGYKNLNLNDVAKELKISKTTLYKNINNKYDVATMVVDRLLEKADLSISELLQMELSLPEKLRKGLKIISSIFTKMDREFLNDLENTLPELWEKIDAARKEKEKLLIKMLSNEQKHGNLRMDLSPELLAPLLLTLIRGMYNPTFSFKQCHI